MAKSENKRKTKPGAVAGLAEQPVRQPAMADGFPIVAVGASAGGVEEVLEERGTSNLSQLFRILKQVGKVDFSDYKPATVRRRVMRRMALKKIDSLSGYLGYLRKNSLEAEALYQDILVNVTSFFRNPDAFDALKELVYPALLKDREPTDTIRIWVPGCSTGEEAYSHAISFVEFLSEMRAEVSLQVFATDLSEAAVQRARAGVYQESIIGDVSRARARRFFNKVEGGFQISKSIRDLCIFARQNVFSDPPFSKMDIVSCRNLLIYLGPVLQRKVIPVFHYALRSNRYLMLGSSEGLLGAGSDLFDMIDKKNKIYRRRAVASSMNFGFSMDTFDSRNQPTQPTDAKEPEHRTAPVDLQREADRLLLARYVPASAVVNEQLDILQTRGHTGKYLELSPGKASLNLLRMARPGLLLELEKAIEAARKSSSSVFRENIQVENNGDLSRVNIEIVPLRTPGSPQPNFLIIFHDVDHDRAASAVESHLPVIAPTPEADRLLKQIEQLKQELAATREYLQLIIEEREATNQELQSANEEIKSGNEELQSANKELQTSKEELESANEELNTVNEEMQHRNIQLSQLNNDLTNLLNSVNIPIVMLGQDLSVRRFTLQAEHLLGLSAIDVGRPISNLRMKVHIADLEKLVLDVIHDILPRQQEFRDAQGDSYTLRITPYRTSENRIEGAVLMLLDRTPTILPARAGTKTEHGRAGKKKTSRR